MAYYNGNGNGSYDGQGRYYYYPSAPVTFQGPSGSYVDNNYRRDYRRQDSDQTLHGLMPMEQVFATPDGGVPWWLNPDHPHGGHDGHRLHPYQIDQYNNGQRQSWHQEISTVEMYVPMCCDECERKVRKHLKNMAGVESVIADQWGKKVVVHGSDLHPHSLLRRMQRDKADSVFWSDRPR